jgi:negative regulator of flagellin synthesis FlgM
VTIIQHSQGVTGPGSLGAGAADKTQTAPNLATQPQTQAPSGSGTQAQPGEVEITPTAQLLAGLAQQIAATPDIDQSRVDAVRQALGGGSYQINSSRIADGLLTAQKIDAQAAAGAGPGAQSTTAKAFAATAQLGSERS